MLSVFVFAVASYSIWTWVGNTERLAKYRIHASRQDARPLPHKSIRIILIALFAVFLYTSYISLGYDYLIHNDTEPLFVIPLQVLGVLVIYDFMFYWVHRTFHLPLLMKYVHHVHHKVRYPMAVDDLYLHPVDTLWVTTLLFISIAIVGPLSTPAFITTLFIYVFINNTIHSGMKLTHPIFALTNYWARMHDGHHAKNPRANFGSIFPVWDAVFGTRVR